MADVKTVRVTLVKSPIGYNQKQKDTVKALGLRKINSTRVLELTPQKQGMITKVSHLIKVEEVTE